MLYCGASWADAAKCTHGRCHTVRDCPKEASNCYGNVKCSGPTPTPSSSPTRPPPPAPGPKNCGTDGSTTDCGTFDPKCYCGQSKDPKARFTDGTGCSCGTGYQFDSVTHKCVDNPATMLHCGASWADASKCTHDRCHNDGDCPKEAPNCYGSVKCSGPTPTPPSPPTPPTPPAPGPKNCGIDGSTTNCLTFDSKAYCGQSKDQKARFTDGTGCSCDTGYQFDSVTHKCVDDPATKNNYCGASWGDASKCTHGRCHNDGDCPKEASNCYASVK